MTDPRLPFELGWVGLENTAFEGENNAYVLGTEPGATTALVDTGVALPETREQLREALAARGLEFADVEEVFLTHWHGDHSGLAGEIQRAGGATVRVHAGDAPLVAGDREALDAMDAHNRELFDEWGMPDGPRETLLEYLNENGLAGEPPDVTPFADGDRFDLGSVELEAVHLPGHTDGLCGFAVDGRDGRELFSGDALLPYYTPNVGGADTRVERPLAKYLDALARIVEGEYTRAWPGHRGPVIDPSGRAADIVVHHRARTERVVDFLASGGPADAWTVSAHLFGELAGIHVLHGPGEAYAHLQHLAAAGVVEQSGRAYELVEPDADLDALFPAVPAGAKDSDAIPGPADD